MGNDLRKNRERLAAAPVDLFVRPRRVFADGWRVRHSLLRDIDSELTPPEELQ